METQSIVRQVRKRQKVQLSACSKCLEGPIISIGNAQISGPVCSCMLTPPTDPRRIYNIWEKAQRRWTFILRWREAMTISDVALIVAGVWLCHHHLAELIKVHWSRAVLQRTENIKWLSHLYQKTKLMYRYYYMCFWNSVSNLWPSVFYGTP